MDCNDRCMRIAISGVPGSGKSTVAKIVADKLQLPYYSIGKFMRELAEEKGISLADLHALAESDSSIDQMIDEKQKYLDSNVTDFVLDSRLGWHFVSNSYNIFLDCSLEESMRRIFIANRSGESASTIDEVKALVLQRRISESQRYLKYYGIDYTLPVHYRLCIDTTDKVIDSTSAAIIENAQNYWSLSMPR